MASTWAGKKTYADGRCYEGKYYIPFPSPTYRMSPQGIFHSILQQDMPDDDEWSFLLLDGAQ